MSPEAGTQMGKIYVRLAVHASAQYVVRYLPVAQMPDTGFQAFLSLTGTELSD